MRAAAPGTHDAGAKAARYSTHLYRALRTTRHSDTTMASANPSMATDLHGSGQSVVDGDEFILCEGNACTNIRLCGIDTPSKGKPGYDKTISALTKLVVGKKVLCRPVSQGSVSNTMS